MPALKIDKMEIQSNENTLDVTMNDESVFTIQAERYPDVYIKCEVVGTKSYIYMKALKPVKAYTFITNETIKYRPTSQMHNGSMLLVRKWSNFHNPKTGKIAGFTVNDVFDKPEYKLFLILDNVTSNFKLDGEQVVKDVFGKSLLCCVE